MGAHETIQKVCAQAQTIATDLHVERKRRMKVEAENEELQHKLRTIEIALHSNAPMDALDVIQPQTTQRRINH